MKTIAEIIFEGEHAQSVIEDELIALDIQFEDTSYDNYDNSMELYDVPNECRLSVEAQKLLFDAGFSKIYLNHNDKWETHYTFQLGEFREVKGWRVSYPSKRGENENGIWVEEKVDSWPPEWFETGYAIIKEKLNE